MNFLKISIGVLKGVRTFLFALLLMTSLAFNATFLFWEVGSSFIWSMVDFVGMPSVSQKQKLVEINRRNSKLEKDLKLANVQLAEKTNELQSVRAQQAQQKSKFKKLHGKARKRLAKMTVSNVTSVAAEAVPVIGIGVLAASTAYELRQACKMAGFMSEINRLFDLKDEDNSRDEICGLSVPSFSSLIESVESGFGGTLLRIFGYSIEEAETKYENTKKKLEIEDVE